MDDIQRVAALLERAIVTLKNYNVHRGDLLTRRDLTAGRDSSINVLNELLAQIGKLEQSVWRQVPPTAEQVKKHADLHGVPGLCIWLHKLHAEAAPVVVMIWVSGSNASEIPSHGFFKPIDMQGTPVPWPDSTKYYDPRVEDKFWLSRIPTSTEFDAHTAAHGPDGYGLWQYRLWNDGKLSRDAIIKVGPNQTLPSMIFQRERWRPLDYNRCPVPWPAV